MDASQMKTLKRARACVCVCVCVCVVKYTHIQCTNKTRSIVKNDKAALYILSVGKECSRVSFNSFSYTAATSSKGNFLHMSCLAFTTHMIR